MKYRCPYCGGMLAELHGTKCPHCGRYMLINVPGIDRESVAALGAKRRERQRALDRIHRQYERKRKEVLHGSFSPSMLRSPTFYLGVIVVLAVVGSLLFNAADKSVVKKKESPYQVAMRHVDVLAEALGRYRFHVGSFPTAEQGLAALVRDPGIPGWVGPYINHLRSDPWGTPFVYEPRQGAVPTLISSGPDKQRGTDDDIAADPECFDPGTEWTNGWVSAEQRSPGVVILESDPSSN